MLRQGALLHAPGMTESQIDPDSDLGAEFPTKPKVEELDDSEGSAE